MLVFSPDHMISQNDEKFTRSIEYTYTLRICWFDCTDDLILCCIYHMTVQNRSGTDLTIFIMKQSGFPLDSSVVKSSLTWIDLTIRRASFMCTSLPYEGTDSNTLAGLSLSFNSPVALIFTPVANLLLYG